MTKLNPEDVLYVQARVFFRRDDMLPVTETDGERLFELMERAFEGSGYHWDELVMTASTNEDLLEVQDYYDKNLMEWDEGIEVPKDVN